MPHIHTKPGQHDHTVSCYIINLSGDEPLVWLHMHKKLGRLLPAGGHIELNENPWDSLSHEILEETGYTIPQLKILQPTDRIKELNDVILHPLPLVVSTQEPESNHFHIDSAFAFVTKENPQNKVAEGESNDLRWLTHEQLNNLDTNKEIFANTQQIYNYILENVLMQWDHVDTKLFTVA